MELIKNLGVTPIAALHELNLAAYYCDRLYVLQAGRVVAAGAPEAVLRRELIRAVYSVWTEIQLHPLTGKLSIIFLPEKVGVKAYGNRHQQR